MIVCATSPTRAIRSACVSAAIVCWLGGCTIISIAPSCPEVMEVDESGTLAANQRNPGQIPTYLWEAFPPDAVEFADPALPGTAFDALKPGDVTLRLTATDGLFQVMAECHTSVIETGTVSVILEVTPDPPIVGESATLSCRSTGEAVAVVRTIEQANEPAIELSLVSEGVASFTPDDVVEMIFQCVGQSESGRTSEPSVLTITATTPADDTDDDDDTDDGDDGRDPPRGGRP